MPTVVVHGHRKIDRAIVPCLKEVIVQVILSVSRLLDWLHVLVINGEADSAWPIYGVGRWFEGHTHASVPNVHRPPPTAGTGSKPRVPPRLLRKYAVKYLRQSRRLASWEPAQSRRAPQVRLPCSFSLPLRSSSRPTPSRAFGIRFEQLLDRAGRSLANDERHSSGCTLTEPRNIPGTVKLWESPRQSRGVSRWTNASPLGSDRLRPRTRVFGSG